MGDSLSYLDNLLILVKYFTSPDSIVAHFMFLTCD